MTKLFVSEPIRRFAERFPVPLYIVGGYVRDGLDGIASDDVDITSSLSVSEVEALVGEDFFIDLIKKDTGTVCIRHGDEIWQYTAFRKDVYGKGHTPVETIPASMEEDAFRRDFKANAVYYDIKKDEICDLVGGVTDIENKVLSATRPPEEVFGEDGLRLMRLARIAAETGYEPDEEAMDAAKKNAFRIDEIAPDRIRVELGKILHADKKRGLFGAPSRGLNILQQTGVLERILPEISKGDGMPQRSDYHKFDVFGHTLTTVDYADDSVRTAAFFHDIGKPFVYEKRGNFYGHDVEGESLCEAVMTRLRYSKSEILTTKRLVRWHMLDMSGDMRENKIRLFVQQNADIIDRLCLLKRADACGCGYSFSGESASADRLQKTLFEMKREGVPFSVKDLLVTGKDFPPTDVLPAAKRGEAMKELLKACSACGSRFLTRENQILFLQTYIKRSDKK